MMPAGGAQKLKLLTGNAMPTVQYIRANTGDQVKATADISPYIVW